MGMVTSYLALCVAICGFLLTGSGSILLDSTGVGSAELQIQDLQQKVALLERAVSSLASKVSQATSKTKAVAFTATLTTTIPNMQLHQHIKFDHVLTNEGSAYDASTGTFTAPVSGVYAFYLTVTNTPQYSASLVLAKNGNPQASVLAHGTPTSGWQTSTIATMVTLHNGEQVWAQDEGQFSTIEQLDGYEFSSFSGHLVAPF
ncbi:hypothetical protein CHS0354_012489 [Potamilus streckersoni]|uniref:C1q domain-containing protein n=1 Tax=Potamilus streckersoni TaxID=2493646 RepID=A0AAE0S005_9BIVA|nr:hypothetical protein CHS0354_012489 [Potamilus streckersoni]